MTLKLKKAIAREGLIFLAILVCSLGIFVIFTYPIYLIIRFIIWAIKTLRSKDEFAPQEALLLSEIDRLVNEKDYLHAVELLHDFEVNRGASPEKIIKLKKLYLHGFVVELYGQGAVFMEKKEYAKTKECLKQVQDIIVNNLEIFDIDKQLMGEVLSEMMDEFKDKKMIITTEEMTTLRDKYNEKIKSLFKNDNASGNMRMLIDSFIMPAFCDSQDSTSDVIS